MLMRDLISAFPGQLREALNIGRAANLQPLDSSVRQVIVTGLGGSGIGGTILSQITDQHLTVPLLVNKDYFLPAFTDSNTLVIVSSYSGNTEETISAMHAALEKGARVCCITSGGKIATIAKEKGLDLIIIPGGMPPRACLGFSFVQLLFILEKYGISGPDFIDDLENCISLLENNLATIQAEAVKIAATLCDKTPVIYSSAQYEGVAIRLRQQINENGKMLCWHHVLPEMNHNELVGWTIPHPESVVLMLRSADDYERTVSRMHFTRDVVKEYCTEYIEIHSKGETRLQRAMYLIHLGDWISWYIAEKRGIDATEVNIIDRLKKSLS